MLGIGSRGSKLALWQANHVQERLTALGHECRVEVIQTTGDRFQQGPLKEIGNKGLFTKEIEEALLDGRIDLAVHSLKDMPAALPDGLRIAATPEREDARDAMIGSTLAALPVWSFCRHWLSAAHGPVGGSEAGPACRRNSRKCGHPAAQVGRGSV